MKKWLCSVFGHLYDPQEDHIPAEIRGAAVCRFVESHEHPEVREAGTAKLKLLTLPMFLPKPQPESGDCAPAASKTERAG